MKSLATCLRFGLDSLLRRLQPAGRACQRWTDIAASGMMIVALWRIATDLAGAHLMSVEFRLHFANLLKAMVPHHFLPHAFLFVAGLVIRITVAFKVRIPAVFAVAGFAAAISGIVNRGSFVHDLSHAIAGDCTGYTGHVIWPAMVAWGASTVILLASLADWVPGATRDEGCKGCSEVKKAIGCLVEKTSEVCLRLAKPAAWTLIFTSTFLLALDVSASLVLSPAKGLNRFYSLEPAEWMALGGSLFLMILGIVARVWIESGKPLSRLLAGFVIFAAASKLMSSGHFHEAGGMVLLAAAVVLTLAAWSPQRVDPPFTATP